MDDDRVWEFEESLWTGDADHYRESIDADCLMVVPAPPFVLKGEEAVKAVSNTPRWTNVDLSERAVSRPQEGLIVVAYHASAKRAEGEAYQARCTSTYRRLGPDEWRVVQHQQSVPTAMKAAG